MMYQSGYLLKQAWASLKGKPGFVSAVVTTMSLSLGALLCVFTLAYLLLVSPLPYPESDALFTVEHNLVDNNADVDGRAFTYPNLMHLYTKQAAFGEAALMYYDADVLIYMVEVGEKELKNEAFFNKIIHSEIPVILLLNKIDKSSQEAVEEKIEYWKNKVPNADVFVISALEGFNVSAVFEKIKELLPEAPPYYPKDQLTDKPERFFVNEKIREKILMHYKKEIPYSVEVETEAFIEEENIIKIRSVIMVERDTQKGIIIGHKGTAIKRVGSEARKDLELFFDKKVFLELYVKVNKNWRNDKNQLKRFGYQE